MKVEDGDYMLITSKEALVRLGQKVEILGISPWNSNTYQSEESHTPAALKPSSQILPLKTFL